MAWLDSLHSENRLDLARYRLVSRFKPNRLVIIEFFFSPTHTTAFIFVL
jgi:hypothetical protein